MNNKYLPSVYCVLGTVLQPSTPKKEEGKKKMRTKAKEVENANSKGQERDS